MATTTTAATAATTSLTDLSGVVTDYTGLRAYTGNSVNQEVTLASTAHQRAGTFRCLGKTSYADDGGLLIVDAAGRSWLRTVPSSGIDVSWFALDSDPSWSNAFDRATKAMLQVYSMSRTIRLPGEIMKIDRPWIIPFTGAGITIRGDGDNFLASHIDASSITSKTYSGYGAIHQDNPTKAVCRALNIEDVRIGGGNATAYGVHGIYLNQNSSGYWRNVMIEAFKGGSGLVCDSAQDYTFDKVDIQSCGGTSTNVYTDVKVVGNSANTTFPPMNITTTSSNTCNYLRFYDCQWEGNWVSPYVRIGKNSKWIFVTNKHTEHRGFFTNQQDPWGVLFENNGGEIFITGQGVSPEVQYGLTCGPYSRSFVTGCPDMGSISGVTTATNSGTSLDLQISNSEIGKLEIASRGGSVVMTGGKCTGLTSSYPSFKGTFTGVEFTGDVVLQNDSGAQLGLDFVNCVFDTNFNCDVHYVKVIGGTTKKAYTNPGPYAVEMAHSVLGTRGSLHRTSTYVPWGFQPLTGSGKPTVVPTYVGQRYVDSKSAREWIAYGTAAATDFKATNTITYAAAAPSSAPYAVGDVYINSAVSPKKVYLSTGASAAGDWTVLN